MSEHPDYISKIDEVANLSCPPPILARILGEWKNFEQSARQFWEKFDVLHPDFPQEDQMIRLIRLLYDTKTGTPKSDCDELRAKDQAYGGSWCQRGGQGAFFMLSRKADRLQQIVAKHGDDIEEIRVLTDVGGETLADTLGDLRRYLILCVSYRRAPFRKPVDTSGTTETSTSG